MPDNYTNDAASEQRAGATRRSMLLGAGAGVVTVAATVAGEAEAADDPKKRDMEGKTAFITGGARGIGLASADQLAQAGANIVIFDVARNLDHVGYDLASEQDLASAKSQIEAHGVKCITVQGDVRDRAGLAQAVANSVSRFGSLDHVLVNAGITQVGAIEELDDHSVQTVIDINVTGAVRTIQAAVPIMREQKSGSIVVLSSILGRRPNEWYSVYGATKWAVIGLAKSTALAMAPHGVTCNVICPTLVDTPLARSLIPAFSPNNPTWEAVEEFMRARNPLPVDVFQPEDVAHLVKYFASDAAKLITGEVFNLDAGALAAGTV
ncbi:MAG: SDR family NAD(P)-dependent oxidoreductase [Pseudomonadota bacterium]